MTDVTVAPPSGGAPNTAPSSGSSSGAIPRETPINQNPVNQPAPVGAQAPSAPVDDIKGSEHRPQSRREAIKAAFERATAMQDAGDKTPQRPPAARAKPAEAKAGHNNPPETTPEAKKPPAAAQPRGERGQFQPRQPAEPSAGAAVQGNAAQAQQVAAQGQRKQLPPGAPFAEPPPRASERAKIDWADTPESVRGDIHRMHQEFGQAYQRYRGDAEAFQPLRQYDELAKKHGVTLQAALHNYVSMEQKLRSDPIAGLDQIVNNLNLKGPGGERLGLRDIAYHVLSQTPEQLRALQLGNGQDAARQQIGALHQEISGLKQTLQQMHTQQQFTYTRSAVDQFAADPAHARFDELGDLIEQELKLGFTLEQAYRRAELLRPATHAAQTRTTSAQTRTAADRSIHGSPGVAASDAASSTQRKSSPTPRAAVENALRRMNGRA